MRKDGVYAKLFSEQAQWYNIENVDSAKGGALL
jgi:hypothetical protein